MPSPGKSGTPVQICSQHSIAAYLKENYLTEGLPYEDWGTEGQEASRERDKKLKSMRDRIWSCKTKKKALLWSHI